MIDPERFGQLVVEALWLGFVAVLWMVLRIVGLDQEERPMTDNRWARTPQRSLRTAV